MARSATATSGQAEAAGAVGSRPDGAQGRAAETRAGSAARALFGPREDRVGISDTDITLCLHAFLTLGKALGVHEESLNVFWDDLNARGGVNGRRVRMLYEDDHYRPDDAVVAATKCRSRGAFAVIGGPGYDQVPAVRTWAERRMLYLHDSAASAGSRGGAYSFAFMPTVERLGEAFAEIAATRFRGRKVGILRRDSPHWDAAVDAFHRVAEARGVNVVAERSTSIAQSHYHDAVLHFKNQGAEVVWAWETPLQVAQIVKQAKGQGFTPHWLMLTSNVVSAALDDDALQPPLIGVGGAPPYSFGDRSGGFASYRADLERFETAFARAGRTEDLQAPSADLLFMGWNAFSRISALLSACGRDCTRNRLAAVMTGGFATSIASCPVDFSKNPYEGSRHVYVSEAQRTRSGDVHFRPVDVCR